MAALPELEQFDADVFQIETDSVWLGGVDGLANNQGKALANRTKWLKAQLLALLASQDDHEAAADPHPQYATDVSVAAQLAALVNSSPATLDTLKEFADALGNDADFAATTAAALGLRVTIADFQKATAISVVAGGTANAITGAYAPAVAALADGMTLYVRASAANTTTTPNFSPNGLAEKTIVKGNNLPLAVGDISGTGHWCILKYDATLDKWALLNPASAVTTKGVQRFTGNGSFTVPPGVTTIYVSGCAGGGGGGGGGGTTVSVGGGCGAGGSAGQFVFRTAYVVAPGQVIPITIGGGGAGGVPGAAGANGSSGSAGGSTIVGALVTLAGGGGGTGGGGSTGNVGAGGAPGTPGHPIGSYGGDGGAGGIGGNGGSSPFGGGGGGGRSGSGGGIPGSSAFGYGGGGAGGGGSYQLAGPGAAAGNGAAGFVVIEW